MNGYDETPWWCYVPWPRCGPLWCAGTGDPDAFGPRSPGSSPPAGR